MMRMCSGLRRAATLSLVLAAFSAAPIRAEPARDPALEAAVAAVLDSRPEVLARALQRLLADKPDLLGQALAGGERAALETAVRPLLGVLTNHEDIAIIGPADAAVTIVEFSDYNCSFCRGMEAHLERLMADAADVRLAIHEVGLLGPGSTEVAKLALAARGHGRFAAYRQALLRERGRLDRSIALDVAKRAGLDPARLSADAGDPAIEAALLRRMSLFTKIGGKGTPLFVIVGPRGDLRVHQGAAAYAQIKGLVDAVR